MPIWIPELLDWLGLSSTSQRPNLGALLILVGALLIAMGYTPDDVSTFGEKLAAMTARLVAFVEKPDNAIGVAAAAAGWMMTRKVSSGLTPAEGEALRAELAALRARREAARPPLEVDLPEGKP